MKYCPNCKSKLYKKDKSCPECGISIADISSTFSKTKIKKAMALIVFLFAFVVGMIALLVINRFNLAKKESSFISFSDNPTSITSASQSVVKLDCYDRNDRLYATGSGFACFFNNVIVTNYHVIEHNVAKIEATTEDGRTFYIQWILALDKEKDIALLATSSPHNLPLLQQGNSNNLQKGEKVVTIGSPLGLLNSVSTGVFSGYIDEGHFNTLQFTASISSGSSGGALFNDSGEVIGITFASYSDGQNLNLAIPIEYAAQLYQPDLCESSKISIKQFYETHCPIYTIEQVINLERELEGKVFYLEGYYHSQGVYYRDGNPNWETVWCEIYSDSYNGECYGKGFRISYTAIPPDRIPAAIIMDLANLQRLADTKETNTAIPIRIRCEYKYGSSELTLIEIDISN